MQIDIGVSKEGRGAVAEELTRLLADSYALYLKTHNYHWNVTGPLFVAVHKLTEEQYLGLAEAVDEIAERIRTLGRKAPAGFAAFSKLTGIADGEGTLPAEEMVADLVRGHEAVIRTARAVRAVAETAGDETTVGLVDDRLAAHEKQSWMLRSLLAG